MPYYMYRGINSLLQQYTAIVLADTYISDVIYQVMVPTKNDKSKIFAFEFPIMGNKIY